MWSRNSGRGIAPLAPKDLPLVLSYSKEGCCLWGVAFEMFEPEASVRFLSSRTLILGSDLLKGKGIQKEASASQERPCCPRDGAQNSLHSHKQPPAADAGGAQTDRCLLFRDEIVSKTLSCFQRKKESKEVPALLMPGRMWGEGVQL